MRHDIVKTTNVLRLMNAIRTLTDRGMGEEGMGLVSGEPGEGKTTAVSYAVNQTRGVFLRATVAWRVTSMLSALCRELGVEVHPHRAVMLEAVVHTLTMDPRPIFIDEADYLIRTVRESTDMLDAIRYIYDLAQVPVLLIGMEDIAKRISPRGQFSRFHRRITQWVSFQGMTALDAQKVAGTVCEVDIEGALPRGASDADAPPIAGTLVEAIYDGTGGKIGHIVIELGEIERWARTNGRDRVTLEDYTTRRLRFKPRRAA